MTKHFYVLFSAQYAPHVGGVESFTMNLAHELRLLGHEVCIATLHADDSPDYEIDDEGVRVFRFASYSFIGGRLPVSKKNHAYRALMKELLRQPCDRVLINTRFYFHSIEGARFARRCGATSIVLDHGSAHLTLGRRSVDGLIRLYEHVITRVLDHYHLRYAGVSLMSIRWLNHFGLHSDTIIPNAINAGEFRTSASHRSFYKELGFSKDAIVISSVARLSPEKGVMLLAQAAAEMQNKNCVFLFAGDGPLRPDLEKMRIPSLYLLGNINKNDLSALLLQSDIFCLPSRSEGFCTALLEAGACEDAVVITHVGGTDELVRDDDVNLENRSCGYQVFERGIILDEMNPNCIKSALSYLIEKPSERIRMGCALRKHVDEKSNWRKTAEALDVAFE